MKNMGILVLVLGLIEDQGFHFQVLDLVKTFNFWSGYEFFCSY